MKSAHYYNFRTEDSKGGIACSNSMRAIDQSAKIKVIGVGGAAEMPSTP